MCCCVYDVLSTFKFILMEVVVMKRWFVLICVVGLASCQTLEQSLKSVDSALAVVNTGTARNISALASSKAPSEVLKQGLQQRSEYYKRNPQAITEDIRAVKRDFDKLMSLLQVKAGEKWGKQEAKVPTKKQYVKYTQNYQSRAVVDFDQGEVIVETLDERDANGSLRNAIVTTLLTPDDPRSVDLFSDKAVTLSGDEEPYLKGLVVNQKGKSIADPHDAEAYAQYLIQEKRQQRNIDVDGVKKNSTYVKIAMVSNFSNKQAQKYSKMVDRYAAHYNISPSLVYAIMRTESNFNPYAVSPVPAYGLMQLVPSSGGRDAYRRATGNDGIPSKEYLFDANNNIELGTAYLNVLAFNYLKMIQNDVSREYAVISAYNTGAGNVLKTFSKDRTEAVNAINRKSPPEVYAKLRADLPYEETRHYLGKVVDYRKQFIVPVN
jgi:membrane-bound lytic murein transglycosylase C